MNIGIDIRPLISPVRTGVGEYTFELLKAVLQIDKKNQYYLFYNSYEDVSGLIPKWEQSNVHYIQSNKPNKVLNFCISQLNRPKLDYLIAEKIKNNKIDIFFSPNLNFVALSEHVKYVLTIHDLSYEIFPEFFSFKQRMWHKLIKPKYQCVKADIVLVPSESTGKDVEYFYKINSKKIKVLSPGLSSVFGKNRISESKKENIKKKYNLPEKYIFFLGTIEPRKNIIGLIEAYKEARKYLDKKYSLIIAGMDGWRSKDIMNAIKNTNGVKYIGYVDAEDKEILYSMSDLFVYPSFYEGFGFPVLEAFSCGVPVITSNRSSLPEITQSSAYLINPYNTVELVGGIRTLLNDRELRNILVEKGKKQTTSFAWNKTAEKFLEIISRI